MIPAASLATPVGLDSLSPPSDNAWSPVSAGRNEVLGAQALVQTIGRIATMTERLFPGPIRLEHACDPENPADEYLVFDAVAQGEYADYCEREFQWHEEVRKIVPGALGEFRLSVTPQR